MKDEFSFSKLNKDELSHFFKLGINCRGGRKFGYGEWDSHITKSWAGLAFKNKKAFVVCFNEASYHEKAKAVGDNWDVISSALIKTLTSSNK